MLNPEKRLIHGGGVGLVGIEEVAQRNNLVLKPVRSHLGQYMAHCPHCGDTGVQYHLYVSSVKDTFFCQKCGSKGGVIKFHAWLNGLSFEAAKAELYPAQEEKKSKRRLHPAETLTKVQLEELGYTLRTPRPFPPTGWRGTKQEWYKRRRAELDWIWVEWLRHKAFREAQDKRIANMIAEGMATQQVIHEPVLTA